MGSPLGSPRGIATAVVLTIAGIFLAWLCLGAMAGNILAQGETPPIGASPHDPDAVLDQGVVALVQRGGALDSATLTAVRRAATTAPLDGRPYLILGRQQLLNRQPARALATLEAGQRLDPRLGLIHVFLLDRYLRTRRFADAALQMSVLARLVGSTQTPVATALASMALAPETRDAVSRTLRTDPALEKSVLVALARSGTSPQTMFALASPAAHANAGQTDSWGPALVDHLLGQRTYTVARSVWQQIYGVGDAAAKTAIFNAAFRSLPAAPPFNWTLTASGIGAADLKGGGLAIDYYGRDTGDMASQLLVLAPGAYRFTFTIDPGPSDAGSRLFWTLTCAGKDKPLAIVPIVAGPAARRPVADLAVPAGCPAQQLTLRAEAGDLPAPISVTVRSPQIVARSGSRS